MLANNERSVPSIPMSYRTELEYLYARRLAINTLIESLEEYDRVRITPAQRAEMQTA